MELHLKCFKHLRIFLTLVLVFVGIHASAAKPFSKVKITLGDKKLEVELAETADQHARGLMFREKLGENDGMLFIFPGEETRFFWMKNTLIDLSIGYFDASGTLIDVQEMKSGKGVSNDMLLASYPSAKPAKYALEMNKGWFDKNKVKLGTKLKVHH
ncbi:DUF192 domain-containing protein [Bdellovibrio sp. HCB2-146]|uniref:DUF192 domain-containing protein n=1 Tax=Bdellovibrio sp. HCB2-146 TaxID=3394362 RepID=UPI0039BD606C